MYVGHHLPDIYASLRISTHLYTSLHQSDKATPSTISQQGMQMPRSNHDNVGIDIIFIVLALICSVDISRLC